MTTDTRFQKFLMIKGKGGTGKSIAVSLIQYIIGTENSASISLQDLNKRFYATGLFGKILNACTDIPCTALQNVDIIKKAAGEDTLLIYATSIDYTLNTAESILFFKTVQNKMHWSAHGQTAAEKIFFNADSGKAHELYQHILIVSALLKKV